MGHWKANKMSITTSYFAVASHLNGRKIGIVRHNLIRSLENIASFSPSADLLNDYKTKKIEWEGYIDRYLQEQRAHFKRNPEDFKDLLMKAKKEDIVLLCYEKFEGKSTRCHRILLYDFLQEAAKELRLDVEFVDETKYIIKRNRI